MNQLTIADEIVGALVVALSVGSLLWLVLAIRPLRRVFVMHYDHAHGRFVRVPTWRLPVLAGVLAGLVAGVLFAMLAAY